MATRAIADEQIGPLGVGIHGDLLPPDAVYVAVRPAWTGTIDGCPTSTVRRAGVADAIDPGTSASGRNLTAAVRGVGHDGGDTAIGDDDGAIDLPVVDGVRLDPGRRVDRDGSGPMAIAWQFQDGTSTPVTAGTNVDRVVT